MEKPRFIEIDFLRGLAMLAMIIIHTNAYFLGNPVTKFIWNYLQWAVPIFIFCSAFIYYKNQEVRIKNKGIGITFQYLKKRFVRLLKPYYIFAVIFFVALFFREPKTLTLQYITDSLLVRGGIDINWLVLLFIQFTFLMPIIGWLYQKKTWMFWIYASLSLISSLIFIFWQFPFTYKWIMWLPWSLLIIYALLFVRYYQLKWFYITSFLGGLGIFGILFAVEKQIGHSLSFFDNKYPPTLFILSYGIFAIALLHILIRWKLFNFFPVKKLLHFLSMYSYELYFIHYTILFILATYRNNFHFTSFTFFLAVLCPTIIVQLLLNVLKNKVLHPKFAQKP